MSCFRDSAGIVSNASELKAALSEILKHCDDARKFSVQNLGIQINDIKGEKSVWFPSGNSS